MGRLTDDEVQRLGRDYCDAPELTAEALARGREIVALKVERDQIDYHRKQAEYRAKLLEQAVRELRTERDECYESHQPVREKVVAQQDEITALQVALGGMLLDAGPRSTGIVPEVVGTTEGEAALLGLSYPVTTDALRALVARDGKGRVDDG